MPHYKSGPKRGQRMATNVRSDLEKAVTKHTPKKKKTPTGTGTIGGAAAGGGS